MTIDGSARAALERLQRTSRIFIITLSSFVVATDILFIFAQSANPSGVFGDPIWALATILQGSALAGALILTWRSRYRTAIGFVIAGIFLEILSRIPSGVQAAAAFPQMPNIGWITVPVVGPLLFSDIYASNGSLFPAWLGDISALGQIVILVLLILIAVGKQPIGHHLATSIQVAGPYCQACGANGQTGVFCSKCGTELSKA